MTDRYVTDADVPLPAGVHRFGCACPWHAAASAADAPPVRDRRLFTGLLLGGGALGALPAWAREGVEVGAKSRFTGLVSADEVEKAAVQNYAQMRQEAAGKNALLPASHPQAQRLRAIAERLIPHTLEWNSRAQQWKWEVSLIGSQEVNAFCMPGGKIAFYFGILQKLQLSDDEVAMIMGHEMAHALREHARERMGKTAATRVGIGALSAIFGLGDIGRTVADTAGQLAILKFSREDESEADLVGMELAARGGYDPASGVTLWQKMMAANKGAPPQFLSTHPASDTRIRDIQASLPKVEGLYQRAPRPERRFGPPTA